MQFTSESGSPYITFPNDKASFGKTIETFDGVVARIERKDFEIPERPKKLCKNCDVRFYRDAKKWEL